MNHSIPSQNLYIMKSMLCLSALAVLLSAPHLAGAQDKPVKNVAIFIHQAVEILDFTGPAEVFSKAKSNKENLFNVYTVAVDENEILSNNFLKIKPNYSIANCPKPDIIILPGGDTRIPLADNKVKEWIQQSAANNATIMSVCTGAFLLANAGLLDGKKATTHFCCQDGLQKDYPRVTVVKGKRFIDNGNIITTEGISAGIDGSLYLLARMYSQDIAKETAHYMMYRWTPEAF